MRMAKCIKVDDLIPLLDWDHDEQAWYINPEELEHLEENAVDAVPVVHGEFARLPEEVIPCLHVDPVLCKTCNTTFFTFNKEGKRLMLCPYCGARYSGAQMDGESEEEV